MKNIWILFFCFIVTQLNAQIELYDLSTKNVLKVEMNTTRTPELYQEQWEALIAEDGEPFFCRKITNDSEIEEIWLRRPSDTSFFWNVYHIKKVEGRNKRNLEMVFEKTILDEHTFTEALTHEDYHTFFKIKRINSNTLFVLPDSMYIVENKQGKINKTNFFKLLPSGDTIVVRDFKITNHQIDQMDNWSKQTKTVRRPESNYRSGKYDVLSERKIYYQDSFMREPYYEIVPSLVKVNGKEMTHEGNEKAFEERRQAIMESTGGSIGYDSFYDIIATHFLKRYYNSTYFFEIMVRNADEKEILKTRLFNDYVIKILRFKDKAFYYGRFHSDGHWMDESRSFQVKKSAFSENMERITKTGKTKEVNGYLCDEYKMEIASKVKYYYVTEELPFIDYFISPYTFPGFVLRIEEDFDEIGHVVFEYDVKKVDYPAHFLEFTKKGQKKMGIKFNYLSPLNK